MSKLIGIDTGGTYTDAVIHTEGQGVLAKAKALTTRHDLAIGIGEAIDAVMAAAGAAPEGISLVSASTTLATNALVEHLGDRAGLVLIGFDERDLDRAGLGEALAEDRVVFLAGGHNAHGVEVAPLDRQKLAAWIDKETDSVSAFAVAAQFSVANPEHELAARDLLAERTGKPVTCSHEISAKLNAPRRALTALLNARLIGVIQHLIASTLSQLHMRGITAPLMVVKGDGSLISAAEAQRKPIETILSGPAASIVGASYLTGLSDAVVADIGGTTTDVAFLKNGRPRLDKRGANVGGWLTMVEAVAMHTVGLGGDSDIRQDPRDLDPRLTLGPRKVMPVSLLATRYPDIVHAALDRQLRQPAVAEHAGRFALASARRAAGAAENEIEAEILAGCAAGAVALQDVLATRRHHTALQRLQSRGAVHISGFCPSDAAHVLGWHRAWDREAATKAAELFAARRTARGEALAENAAAMSRMVVTALMEASAETLLDAGFAEDGDETRRPSAQPLVQAALRGETRLVRLDVGLAVPVVALGASASTYYPAVAERLRTEAVIPEHAEVANAVGAVVGQVRVEASVTISTPGDSLYRVHLTDGPQDFRDLEPAVACAEAWLRTAVAGMAAANGAQDAEIVLRQEKTAVAVGGEELFLEMTVTATGIGRPAIA